MNTIDSQPEPLSSADNFKATSESDLSELPKNKKEAVNIPQLLNKRASQRNKSLEALETDASLASSKTFSIAKMFTINPGDIDTLFSEFETVSNSLLTRIKQATDKRLEQYVELLYVVTQTLLDKIVFNTPEQLSENATDTLNKLAEKLKENNIDPVLAKWDSKDLKKAFGAGAVSQIQKILK